MPATGAAPPWLGNPTPATILTALLDREEKARARGATGTTPLRLSKGFPSVFEDGLDSEKETFYEYVERLEEFGWIAVKLDKALPAQAAYERNPRIWLKNEDAVRNHLGRTSPVRTVQAEWRDAVLDNLDASDLGKTVASNYLIAIDGVSAQEIVQQLNLLHGLRHQPLMLREVSARLFWGMSKVLDDRERLVAAVLGLDECPFEEPPVILNTFLPSGTLSGVLLIENQTTFERAVRSRRQCLDGLALVYASGFRTSAKRIRCEQGSSISLVAGGCLSQRQLDAFRDWLYAHQELPCWFWGDLDNAGMRILAAMRDVFPSTMAWEPGYRPMAVILEGGGGHRPKAAMKDGQSPIELTGCPYADAVLLPLLARTGEFLDQESVDAGAC